MSSVSISIPVQTQFKPFAAVPKDLIWRLSVDQYHQMVRNGILTTDDQVELLEGMLVYKMPKNPVHCITTRSTIDSLQRIVPTGWYVNSQDPVTLEESEPEPDVMIVRGNWRQYRDRHPGPRDLALIVEVANSTLNRDRNSKKRVYARDGIVCYWIINLIENRVEVYTDPFGKDDDADYGQRVDYAETDELPVVIDGAEIGRIKVSDLLP